MIIFLSKFSYQGLACFFYKPITGDSVRYLVRFKTGRTRLADKASCLEFAFSNGKPNHQKFRPKVWCLIGT